MKNRTIAFVYVDNAIDLITNSSSELFTIRATQPKEVIEALVGEAMGDIYYSMDVMRLENSDGPNDEEWQLEQALSVFAPEDREEVRAKYFNKAKYYAVVVDRDAGYDTNFKHHDNLIKLGFELVTTDY